MRTAMLIVIGGLFLLMAIALITKHGVKVDHNLQGAGRQKISLPETQHVVEIERKNGKPPIKLNIKTPPREIEVERQK